MRYSVYMGAILFVLLSFTAFSGFFLELSENENYDVNISDTFRGAYTNTTELTGIVEDTTDIGINMTDQAKDAKQLEGDFEDPSKAQVKTLKVVFGSYDIVKNMVVGVSELLHIPPVIVGVFLAFLVFGLVFGFISMIFRWRS